MLYALIGSSGSGKTTIGSRVFGKDRELVSFTTRPKRLKEVDGVDYHFISIEEFKKLKAKGLLAEETEYAGNHYGLTMEEIISKGEKGDCYAVVDFHGYTQLKENVKEIKSIFIHVDKETLKGRLELRGETPEFIHKRLELYEKELLNIEETDIILPNNDTLEQAVTLLKSLI